MLRTARLPCRGDQHCLLQNLLISCETRHVQQGGELNRHGYCRHSPCSRYCCSASCCCCWVSSATTLTLAEMTLMTSRTIIPSGAVYNTTRFQLLYHTCVRICLCLVAHCVLHLADMWHAQPLAACLMLQHRNAHENDSKRRVNKQRFAFPSLKQIC